MFKNDIEECLKQLYAGGIILYPTDTIWGLGCDATNEKAIDRIFHIKHRSAQKSMIILVRNAGMIKSYVKNPSSKLIDYMSKASSPTTGIFNDAVHLPVNLINQDGSVGIRIASDDFCSELLQQFKKPIISTSANISQKAPPQNFDEIDPILIKEVDYTVMYKRKDSSKKNPSHIIRLDGHDEVERIR